MTRVDTRSVAPPSWRARSEADLIAAQLRGIEAFHRRPSVTQGAPGPHGSREQRLDESRRLDVADRERRALLARAEAAQRDEYLFGNGSSPRAVVAHRNAWLRDKLTGALRAGDVLVVASTDDGAEASAAIAFDQPDIVIVEDLLPILSGVEVMRRAVTCAPGALIAAQSADQTGMPALRDAGARAVFSRRIPPHDIAQHVLRCLYDQDAVLSLV